MKVKLKNLVLILSVVVIQLCATYITGYQNGSDFYSNGYCIYDMVTIKCDGPDGVMLQ